VKWPKVIKAGSLSNTLTCQTDMLATCAELVDKELPDNAGEDSESILPIFKGEPVTFTRKGIISHSFSGHFAYRQGKWKLLLAKGSGGWTMPNEQAMSKVTDAPKGQLYDLEADPGEQNNLFLKNPEVVEKIMAQLEVDVANGRSTAGPKQENDIPVDQIKLWKSSQ
jgi:hypothetical protein